MASVTQPRGKAEGHPSGDHRYKMLDACLKRYRYQPDALIEVLHTAQELFGFLQNDLLHYIAHALKLPPSRVYGVATFYHFFTFQPRGDHTCVVCMGTACYVKGSEALLSAVQAFANEQPDARAISVETARCLGACGLAPVAVFDGEVCGTLAARAAIDRMKGWVDHGRE